MDMSGDFTGTDYSDFEYQFVDIDFGLTPSADTTNIGAEAVYTIEPLQFAGGLSQNEVAELVYLETYAGIELEDEAGNQQVATTAETRGAVGINLPNSQDAFISKVQTSTGDPVDASVEVVGTNNGVNAEDDIRPLSSVRTDERFLQAYRAKFSPPFDDTGPGGSGSHDHFHDKKHFRRLTGRGPVFDANDDLSVSTAFNVGSSVTGGGSTIRLQCVWDVAEVDDAGRAFSVPEGM